MKDNDYTLENLSAWVDEALSSGYTPNEVYDTIIETVKKNMKYHKACYDDSVRLLALLRGNKNTDIKVHSNLNEEWKNVEFPYDYDYTIGGYMGIKQEDIPSEPSESDYWDGKLDGKEFKDALERYGYEYTPGVDTTKFKLDSPDLHSDEDEDI